MAELEAARTRIRELDARAFELAKQRFAHDGGPTDAVRTEAEGAQKELRELARAIRSQDPGAYESISEQVSEALLDLKYALTAPPAVSLRMNQYMDSHERPANR